MFIIKGILNESDAEHLSDRQWKLLANCSSDSIVQDVFEYCSKSDNEGLVGRIKQYYAYEFGVRSLGIVEEFKQKITYAVGINYQDVIAESSVENLTRMRDAILDVNRTENTSPYISPIDNDNFSMLLALIKDDKDKKMFSTQLTKYSHMFKSKPYEHARGTLFKPVYASRGKFDLILEGLKFLLKSKEEGISPERWRHL